MIGTLSTLATRVYGSTITASIRYGAVLARAGGRKSHSSSSSSSSYGSRGGGSIGGVVGGLVFLVLVAGVGYFVFQRMKSKDPAKAAAMAAGAAGFMAAGVALAKKVQEEAGKASSSGGGAGVAAIKAHDPAFDETAFLAGTEKQFFIIQKAWTDQDPDQSRQVMADGIWQTHRTQITDQQAKGVRSVMDDLAVNKASIVRADSSGGKDSVSVKFEARCRDYEVDAKTMKRKGGDKDIEAWTEIWTFQRAATAVTQAGAGTLSQKCPNCGAPLKVDLAGRCKYCKANVMAGDQDWVLVRIDEAS